jgi:hypothetical protein
MGEITKTIAITVPSNIVYAAIKETYLSGWAEKYCEDLTVSKGWLSVKDLVTEYSLSRDVPNSELIFTAGKWGTKVEERFTLHSVGEKNTEVTYHVKYRLTFDAAMRSAVIANIGSLLMLEYGYKQASRNE